MDKNNIDESMFKFPDLYYYNLGMYFLRKHTMKNLRGKEGTISNLFLNFHTKKTQKHTDM